MGSKYYKMEQLPYSTLVPSEVARSVVILQRVVGAFQEGITKYEGKAIIIVICMCKPTMKIMYTSTFRFYFICVPT